MTSEAHFVDNDAPTPFLKKPYVRIKTLANLHLEYEKSGLPGDGESYKDGATERRFDFDAYRYHVETLGLFRLVGRNLVHNEARCTHVEPLKGTLNMMAASPAVDGHVM